MFKKLFGETNQIQENHLQKKLLITLALIAVSILCLLFKFETGAGAMLAIACYFWSWDVMKGLFGIASFGAIFAGSRNIVIGAIIFLLYVLIGYFAGIFSFILGLVRFIYLKVNKTKKQSEEVQ